jgi:hypothetical protein
MVPRYTVYPAVPLTAFQLRVADVETPVALFAGEMSVGAGTTGTAVLKDHTAESASLLLLFGSRLATIQ